MDQSSPQKRESDSCSNPSECCEVGRRHFVQTMSIGSALVASIPSPSAALSKKQISESKKLFRLFDRNGWPVLKKYPQSHTAHIALPLGGIGTGTVSLGGRGDLRDWEIMNRPAKGFVPSTMDVYPFFCIYLQDEQGNRHTRVLEGPLELMDYEGSHGSTVPNDNLPRFQHCAFAAAYPFGQVALSDPDLPVNILLQGWNPLVPADADKSGFPAAILRYKITNRTRSNLAVSVCGSLPNFIGMDGWDTGKDWKGDPTYKGAKKNKNRFRKNPAIQGIFMESEGIEPTREQWGTIALTTTASSGITYRTDWLHKGWGGGILDFWDDFSADGQLEPREHTHADIPLASLAVSISIPPRSTREVTFLLTWHFPNRQTWTPRGGDYAQEDCIQNYYTTQFKDAWDVANQLAPQLSSLEQKSLHFVQSFCDSSLPDVVKEAALFNLSTHRTQTCFRTPDGRFFGFEGLGNHKGCCWGSCTHVWNYEQATAYVFGDLAKSMREVEFGHATNAEGSMSFRVQLPIQRAQRFGKAAADGQMGCIMKMYRDWQLSGDDAFLKKLWPHVRRAVEFCWIPGGWDADRDGVMEGCQHNTMDVEYYGPNPQMGIWYLGALRAAQEMARHLGETEFADTCKKLYRNGSRWIDQHLFNGEYYEHHIQPPHDKSNIAPSLLIGMGAKNVKEPEFQLGSGCLVDQLVGQFMAHVCGLGYLVDKEHVKQTLKSILKYNQCTDVSSHFNNMRSFVLGNEAALLMASYPKDRPKNPFPYFTEAMTGFEYAAAIGMLYEDMIDEGLGCIKDIRNRYDGLKRNPFNEAECGHHYARAMASWAAVLALTGFHFSNVTQTMSFAPQNGHHFWSNGYAWGMCKLKKNRSGYRVELSVEQGILKLKKFVLSGFGECVFDLQKTMGESGSIQFTVPRA